MTQPTHFHEVRGQRIPRSNAAIPSLLPCVLVCALGCGSEATALFVPRDGSTPSDASTDAADASETTAPTCAERVPRQATFDVRFDSDTKTATIVGERKLRGLWDHLTGLETDDETLGRARIAERITWLKQHKVNAVFIWTVSRYLNAVRSGKSDEQMPWATWDPILVYREAAAAAGIEFHLWFSPFYYKETFRSHELVDHPEWAILGVTNGAKAIDPAITEVTDHELELIRFAADHYCPDGLQLEEPYYNQVEVPKTSAFTERFKSKYGAAPGDTATAEVNALKEEIIGGFVDRVRVALRNEWPDVVFQVNGPGDVTVTSTGLDPEAVARSGSIDVYVPQIYTTNETTFATFGTSCVAAITPYAGVFAGVPIAWSGSPDGNPAAPAELAWVEAGPFADSIAGAVLFSYSSVDLMPTLLTGRDDVPVDIQFGASAGEDTSDPTWVGSGNSSALSFDGVDDFVSLDVGHSLDAWGQLRVEARVRVDTKPSSTATLLQRGDQHTNSGFLWVYLDSELRLAHQIANGSEYIALLSDPMPALLDGAFHTLEVEQDRRTKTVRFFMDGAPYGASTYELDSRPVIRGRAWIGTYGGRTETEYLFHGAIQRLTVRRH